MKPMCRVALAANVFSPQTLITRIVIAAIAIAAGLFSASASVLAAETRPALGLPRTNLLVFQDRAGAIRTVESKSDWLRRRAEIVAGMEAIMGPLPGREKRCPLDIRVTERLEFDGYSRFHLTYAAEPGSRVPAYLLVPETVDASLALPPSSSAGKGAAELMRGRFPAVLALHSTDLEYGNRVLVEQLRPQYRAYGVELVRRGYVVLAPAYPLMAAYQPDLRALGYRSGTMKAIWDNTRGLDLLESLPFVRRGRFGAIGHSLGGHNAIFTAVFDPRIKVVVSSCGFDSFRDYQGGHLEGWTSSRYMPALLAYRDHLAALPFDFHELIGALAPRPVFINAPLGDTNFKSASVDRIVEAARAVYRLYGTLANLEVVHPACGHDFPAEAREQAYRVLDRTLK